MNRVRRQTIPTARYGAPKANRPPEMAEKPPSLRMVGPADYILRAGRVGVLKREHQRCLSD